MKSNLFPKPMFHPQRPLTVVALTFLSVIMAPNILGVLLVAMIIIPFLVTVACVFTSPLLTTFSLWNSWFCSILNENYNSNILVLKSAALYLMCWKHLTDAILSLLMGTNTGTKQQPSTLRHAAQPFSHNDGSMSPGGDIGEASIPKSSAREESMLRRCRKPQQFDDNSSVMSRVNCFRVGSKSSGGQVYSNESHVAPSEDSTNLRKQLEEAVKCRRLLTKELQQERDEVLRSMETIRELKRSGDNRLELERLLEEERKRTQELRQTQHRQMELFQGAQLAAIEKSNNLSAALAIERQRVEKLNNLEKELSGRLEEEISRNIEMVQAVTKHQSYIDLTRLLETERKKNSMLVETQRELHEAMENGKQLGDLFPAGDISDPEKSLRERMHLVQSHVQQIEKTSTSTRLRLIKSQKLLLLERERAEALEEEMSNMQSKMEACTSKLADLERQHADCQSQLRSERQCVVSIERKCAEKDIHIHAEKATQKELRGVFEAEQVSLRQELASERHRVQSLAKENIDISKKNARSIAVLEEKESVIKEVTSKCELLCTNEKELLKEIEAKNSLIKEQGNRITNLEVELQKTSSQLEEAKASLSSSESKNDELYSSLMKQKEDLKQEQIQRETIVSEINILRGSFREMQSELEVKKNHLISSQESIQTLSKSCEDANNLNREKTLHISNLEKQIESMQQVTNSLQGENFQIAELLKETKERLAAHEDALKRTEAEKDILKNNITTLEEHKAAFSKSLEISDGNLVQQASLLEEARKCLDEVKKDYSEYRKRSEYELADQKVKLETLEQYQEDAKLEAQQIHGVHKSELENLQQKLNLREARCAELEEQVRILGDEVRTSKEDTLKEVDNQVKCLEKNHDALSQRVEEETNLRSSAEASLRSVTEESNETISSLQRKTLAIEKSLQEKESLLAYEKETLETLERMYGELQAEFESERSTAKRLEKENSLMAENVRSTVDDLETTRSLLESRNKKLELLQNALEQTGLSLEVERDAKNVLESENNELRPAQNAALRQLHSLEAEIDKRQVVIDAKTEECDRFENEVSRLVHSLQASERECEGLKTSVNELKDSQKQSKDEVLRLKSLFEERLNLMKGMEQELSSEKMKSNHKEKQILSLNGLISDLKFAKEELYKSSKRQLLESGLKLKERDLMLFALAHQIGAKRDARGTRPLARAHRFIQDLSRIIGRNPYTEQQQNCAVAVYDSSNLRRLGLGLGLTIPLVPIIAFNKSNTRNIAVAAPILSMLGMKK